MKRPMLMGFSALASFLLVGSALAQPDPDDLEVTMTVAEPDSAASGSRLELQEDGDANDVDEDQADDVDDGNADHGHDDDANDVDNDADEVDDGEANDGDDGDANDGHDGDDVPDAPHG